MKKTLKGILALCAVMGMGFAANAAEVTTYDEFVKISGKVKDAAVGETVTVTVLNEDVSLENINSDESVKDSIVFYGETVIGEDNTYSILFSINGGGKHYGYIGVRGKDEPEKIEFTYMSKAFYGEITGAKSTDELSQLIVDNAEILGLDGIEDEEKLQNIAELVFDTLDDFGEDATEENIEKISVIFEKAALINALNNEEVTDINEYYNVLGLSDTDKKYYNDEYSEEITENLSGKNIGSIEEFEELLIGEILTAEVNEASEARIELILRDYEDLFEDSDKDGLAKAIKNEAPFSDIDEIIEFIKDYEEEKGNTSGGSSGSSGGSKGSNSNRYTGTSVATQITQNANDAEENSNSSIFDDIATVPWAKEYIEEMYYSGVISGKAEGKFFPNDAITREEFAKIITLAFKMNLVDDEFPFTDVAETDWSYTYVKTAYLAGVTNGIGNNLFGKSEKITRQDLCTMVYRAVMTGEYELPDTEGKTLNDEALISDYAKEAVRKMVNAGIISGDENANFNPRANATRAEAAKIICLTIRNMK